jgi:hypothetical protein
MTALSAVDRKMLYCPKCNDTYQEGAQRFCSTDGSRLVSSSAASRSANNSTGVFTSLLGRISSASENDEKLSLKPRTPKTGEKSEPPTFHTIFGSKVFNDENLAVRNGEIPVDTARPSIRLIKPNEIASGTAEVGDRKINPAGRPALTRDNPQVLLGQTIKGRYYVTEQLSRDDAGFAYRAEDKIVPHKLVVVRVLPEEKNDDLLSRIFAEERVSLSHINHPNVVSVLDSGELLEGIPFIVTEDVDGFSLREKLRKLEHFNPLRTARIIRQASYALSEVHQNGVLHRSLRPSNIFLTVTEAGTEHVKVTDFVVSNGAKKQNLENVKYLAPEQIEGKMPNYASDVYSLGVVAYEMLTGKTPFDCTSAEQLLKAQKMGLRVGPSKLRSDLTPGVDEVFQKALTYDPADRYPKARDLGDALFHALSLAPVQSRGVEIVGIGLKEAAGSKKAADAIFIPDPQAGNSASGAGQFTIDTGNGENRSAETCEKDLASGELAWEKRSPEPINVSSIWLILFGAGVLLLAVLAYFSWNYLRSSQNQPDYVGGVPNITTQTPETPVNPLGTDQKNAGEIESPPLPRQISQPENTEYFENSKSNLKGELVKNYRGFKLFYPRDWTKSSGDGNFLDIVKKRDGLPVEQMIVTYYSSTGVFSKDRALFPKLVEKSNNDLSKLTNQTYKVISAGEAKIQNGRWNVYEVKFQAVFTRNDGETITLWGRRFWLPPQDQRIKNGFVVTLLATSLSPDVTSVEEVGNKGELAQILENFEPSISD